MKLLQRALPVFLLGCVIASSGCFRQDVKTIVVNVPQMKAPECSKVIQDAMAKVEGIVEVTPDVPNHTLTVRFDSTKLAIKNIEFVIASAGFDANSTLAPAEVRASIPAGCR